MNPRRVISEHFESLVNHVNMVADEQLSFYDQKKRLDYDDQHVFTAIQESDERGEKKRTATPRSSPDDDSKQRERDIFGETRGELNVYKDPYSSVYVVDERPVRYVSTDKSTTTIHGYVMDMRDEMRDELKRLQADACQYYEKVKNINDASLDADALKSKLFVNKFALLFCPRELKASYDIERSQNRSPYQVYLIVFDFYMDEETRYHLT